MRRIFEAKKLVKWQKFGRFCSLWYFRCKKYLNRKGQNSKILANFRVEKIIFAQKCCFCETQRKERTIYVNTNRQQGASRNFSDFCGLSCFHSFWWILRLPPPLSLKHNLNPNITEFIPLENEVLLWLRDSFSSSVLISTNNYITFKNNIIVCSWSMDYCKTWSDNFGIDFWPLWKMT